MKILRVIFKIACFMLLFGFRTESDKRWDVSLEEPTVWLELDKEFYDSEDFGSKVDSLDGDMESLKNVAPGLQKTEIWKLILQDFDSIKTSFLHLRLKPGQIASIDENNKDPYDEAYAQNHTISVVVGSSRGLASGYAAPKYEGLVTKSCTVVIAPFTFKDPVFFKHVLTHEIMHCLGIKHQQEDTNSIMSYANNSQSLSMEERIAITHLYPLEPSYAKETPTFGLACTPEK